MMGENSTSYHGFIVFFAPSFPNWQVDLPLLRRDLALKTDPKRSAAAEAHHGFFPYGLMFSEDQ